MITALVVLAVSVFVVRFEPQIDAAVRKYFAWIERVFGSGK
jgi:hypothetical protein